MDKYPVQMMNEAKAVGATAAEITSKAAEMEKYKELYKNPLFVVLKTYCEIVPLGIVITVISALILKRKPNVATAA